MQEHGTFDITTTGQTIRVRLYDQWNYETSVRFCHEAKTEALLICNRPWAFLIDLSKWELGTPDCYAPFEDVNRWASKHNQICEASIIKLAIHQNIIEKTDLAFTGVKTKLFDNEQEALFWLESQGVSTNGE
ncbi:MAG: hypothetical protein HRT54_08315 [Colwellia sp.]|nr:hypothetical protein [Colwellia sp.]